jgi:integrase
MQPHLFGEAVNNYIHSQKFRRLAVSSKKIYSNGLNILEEHLPAKTDISKITRPMVIGIRDRYYEQPGKCHAALVVLNNVLKYAYDRGHVDRNVAASIGDMPKGKSIPRWQEDEIDRFMDGAPYHLRDAMMVALYTGQRRSDLVRMEWSDYDGRSIHVKQQKTGVELWVPVHPKLKRHLDGMKLRLPQRYECNRILKNMYGQPWAADSLRCAFKRRSAKVGITDRMLHGIRKTTASILAEMGCTALQIMAITGHQTLKEIVRYTQEVEKKRMAQEAMDKWH